MVWRMLALCGAVLLAGCESSAGSRMLNWSPAASERGGDEDAHRREFQTTRSRKAMRWLLVNRLEPGMSPGEVGRILGEDGTREQNDQWLKNKGGSYRVDDVLYRFGPDDRGTSVYLAFRDDKLFNFDPEEFAEKGGK